MLVTVLDHFGFIHLLQVVFGKVLEGMDVVTRIGTCFQTAQIIRHEFLSENVGKDRSDRPLEDVIIVDSGEVSLKLYPCNLINSSSFLLSPRRMTKGMRYLFVLSSNWLDLLYEKYE